MLCQTLQFGYTMSVITLGLHQPHWPTPRELLLWLERGRCRERAAESPSSEPRVSLLLSWCILPSVSSCYFPLHSPVVKPVLHIRKAIASGKLAINFSISPKGCSWWATIIPSHGRASGKRGKTSADTDEWEALYWMGLCSKQVKFSADLNLLESWVYTTDEFGLTSLTTSLNKQLVSSKKAPGFTNLIGALNWSKNFPVTHKPEISNPYITWQTVVFIPGKTRVWSQLETDTMEVPSEWDPFWEWLCLRGFSDPQAPLWV